MVLPSLVALLVVLLAEPNPVRGHIGGAESQGERLRPEHPRDRDPPDGTRRLTVDDTPGIYPSRAPTELDCLITSRVVPAERRSVGPAVRHRLVADHRGADHGWLRSGAQPRRSDALVAMVKAPPAAG